MINAAFGDLLVPSLVPKKKNPISKKRRKKPCCHRPKIIGNVTI
jgi:hypothetical protein